MDFSWVVSALWATSTCDKDPVFMKLKIIVRINPSLLLAISFLDAEQLYTLPCVSVCMSVPRMCVLCSLFTILAHIFFKFPSMFWSILCLCILGVGGQQSSQWGLSLSPGGEACVQKEGEDSYQRGAAGRCVLHPVQVGHLADVIMKIIILFVSGGLFLGSVTWEDRI